GPAAGGDRRRAGCAGRPPDRGAHPRRGRPAPDRRARRGGPAPAARHREDRRRQSHHDASPRLLEHGQIGSSRMKLRVLASTILCLPAACSTGPSRGESMTFTNPVHDANFPDPGAIRVGATWYAYGTNGGGANVPLLTSADLVTWTPRGDALPHLGSWAEPGHTWAPEVIQVTGDRFALYYTARSAKTGRQCVGVAIAPRPEGPFTDDAPEPLICQADEGGSIDASPFRDADG